MTSLLTTLMPHRRRRQPWSLHQRHLRSALLHRPPLVPALLLDRATRAAVDAAASLVAALVDLDMVVAHHLA